MNVSTAINMFIKAVLRESKLPFEIKTNYKEEEIYSKVEEAEKELASNKKRYREQEVIESIKKIMD